MLKQFPAQTAAEDVASVRSGTVIAFSNKLGSGNSKEYLKSVRENISNPPRSQRVNDSAQDRY